MKSKNAFILIGAIVAIVLIVAIITFVKKPDSDPIRFKKEYNMINVSKNNPIIYLDEKTVEQSLSSSDKIIFFGSSKDKNSIKAVEVLLKTTDDYNIDKIYYYSIERDSKIEEILTAKLNKTKIDFPLLVFVKKGKVSSYYESIQDNKNLYEEYEKILIDYTMCSEDC